MYLPSTYPMNPASVLYPFMICPPPVSVVLLSVICYLLSVICCLLSVALLMKQSYQMGCTKKMTLKKYLKNFSPYFVALNGRNNVLLHSM